MWLRGAIGAADDEVVSVVAEDRTAEKGQCASVRVAGDVRIKLVPILACDEAAQEYSLL